MKFFKVIDRYIISQFIQPFLAAFCIALMVLVMQFFFTYLDEIIGKGIGFLAIAEMVGYLSVSLIPMALPIAILLSSVMLFGNLGERFELISIKSSGFSLMRIMLPLIFFATAIAGFSFYCSNNLIPVSNLKFYSKLYDIRQHQPTLAMEPGVFNYDFTGYTVRIGERMPDGRGIKDVLIYDNSEVRSGILKMIRADSGEMFMSGDQQNLIMRLFDGAQYQDIREDGSAYKPFLETFFKEYQLVFDLSGFEFQRTDEDRFKTNRRMLTVGQLTESVDSMARSISINKARVLEPFLPRDHLRNQFKLKDTTDIRPTQTGRDDQEAEERPPPHVREGLAATSRENRKDIDRTETLEGIPQKMVDTLGSFIEYFPADERHRLYSQAVGFIQTHNLQLNAAVHSIGSTTTEMRKQIFDKHRKFALAAVCVIFLFIGAPMGAIIRKGGFGYPLLVSILFFTLYVILYTLFDEMNDAGTIDSRLSAWLSELILFPFGVYLTYQAMKDRKILDISGLFSGVLKFITFRKK